MRNVGSHYRAKEEDSHHVVRIRDNFLEKKIIGTLKGSFQCTFPFFWSRLDHRRRDMNQEQNGVFLIAVLLKGQHSVHKGKTRPHRHHPRRLRFDLAKEPSLPSLSNLCVR